MPYVDLDPDGDDSSSEGDGKAPGEHPEGSGGEHESFGSEAAIHGESHFSLRDIADETGGQRNKDLYRGEGRPDPIEREGSRVQTHREDVVRPSDAKPTPVGGDAGHFGVNVSWGVVAQAGIGVAPGIGAEGGVSYIPSTGEISATAGTYVGMAGIGVMAGALSPSVSVIYESGPDQETFECVQRIIVASPVFVITMDQSIQTPGSVSIGGAAGLSLSLGFFTGYFCGVQVDVGTVFGSEEELRMPFAP